MLSLLLKIIGYGVLIFGALGFVLYIIDLIRYAFFDKNLWCKCAIRGSILSRSHQYEALEFDISCMRQPFERNPKQDLTKR